MGIKRTDLTRPIDIWNLKSVKRQIFWRKMQKLKFHYFTIVYFGNSLVKIKCQIYVPKSSWNDPKSIFSIKVCTITTFFQVLHRKIKYFEKLTRPTGLGLNSISSPPRLFRCPHCNGSCDRYDHFCRGCGRRQE